MKNIDFRKEGIYRWVNINVIIPSHVWKQIKTPGIYFDDFRKILLPFFHQAILNEVKEYNRHIHEDLDYDEEIVFVADVFDECPWTRLAVL